MSGGLIGALKRANETRKPEDSIALRATVLGAVMTSALALVFERAVAPTTGVLLMIALPFAYWVSYRRRGKDNWHIKIGLTIAAILALMRFLGQLGGVATLDEVRFPLADLFLWVQVLHGFDLPARKDLNFSLGSSLTLIAVAGSISQDLRLLFFVIVYCVFVGIALMLGYRSEVNERAVAWLRPRSVAARPSQARSMLRPLALTAVSAVALFLVIPQPTGIRTFALPFSLGGVGGVFGGGGIANPGFSFDPGTRGSATSYYGFGQEMDLRVRGDLSDALVMRVRASSPAMWRGIIFDTYDGVAWHGDKGTDHRSLGDFPPYAYPSEFRSLGPRQTVTQTFYVEAEQANVIFAAGQPDSVWHDGDVSIDSLGGLRLDSTLTPGTVYSVVSSRGAASPPELRALPQEAPPEPIQRYLQLPSDLPDRVDDLAREITADATSDYDRVKAIEAYLARNFEYNIDSPVPPPGRDAVDHFLFDTDVGFCEQFASATAVMLRTLGIPARVVAGYTPGGRNPFTGYHEVRASDAHSWVEVWFPRFGWYEFDPTFDIPPAQTSIAEMLPIARVMRVVAEAVANVIPAGMGGVLRAGLMGLLVAAVIVGIALALRRRPRPVAVPAAAGRLDAGPVVRAFARLEHSFARRGRRRGTAETAAEYLARTGYIGRPDIARALGAFERERYSLEPPSPDAARAAVATLDELAGRESARGPSVPGLRRDN